MPSLCDVFVIQSQVTQQPSAIYFIELQRALAGTAGFTARPRKRIQRYPLRIARLTVPPGAGRARRLLEEVILMKELRLEDEDRFSLTAEGRILGGAYNAWQL